MILTLRPPHKSGIIEKKFEKSLQEAFSDGLVFMHVGDLLSILLLSACSVLYVYPDDACTNCRMARSIVRPTAPTVQRGGGVLDGGWPYRY
jgi:hypothetical protein